MAAATGFSLGEAYIKIESTGFEKFKRDIAKTETGLKSIGTRADGVAMVLRRAFRNTGLDKFGKDLSAMELRLKRFGTSAGMRPSTAARKKHLSTHTGLGDGLSKSQVGKLVSGFDKLQQSIASVEKQMRLLANQAERAGKSVGGVFRRNTSEWRKAGGQISNTKGRLDALGGSAIGVNQNFRQTRYSMLHAGYALKGLKGPVKGVVQGFTDIGTSIAGGLGPIPILVTAASLSIVGLVGVMGKAVSIASKLETGLAEVGTISDEVAADIDGFATRLGKLSIATRTESGLLSAGLYQSISSGITDVDDAFKFLEVSANLARSGLSKVETVVSGLSSALNSFGYEADEAGLVADKFFTTVRLGKLKLENLASAIGKVAPVASQLGVSLDELLAAGAALTGPGLTLSRTFTQIRSIMVSVLKPSSQAQKAAAELGLEFNTAALKAKGLAGFLADVSEKTGGSEDKLARLFGRIEGLSGFLALTNKQAGAFAQFIGDIGNASGATEKALAIMNSTFQAQVDLLKTQFSFVLQQIGKELLPTLTDELKSLGEYLNNVDWDAFTEGIKDSIGVVKVIVEEIARLTKGTLELFKIVGKYTSPESPFAQFDTEEKINKFEKEILSQDSRKKTATPTVPAGAFLGLPSENVPIGLPAFDVPAMQRGRRVALPGTQAETDNLKSVFATDKSKETALPVAVKKVDDSATALTTTLDSLRGAFNQFKMSIVPSATRLGFEAASIDPNASGVFPSLQALNQVKKIERPPVEISRRNEKGLLEQVRPDAPATIGFVANVRKEEQALAKTPSDITTAVGSLPTKVTGIEKLADLYQDPLEGIPRFSPFSEGFPIASATGQDADFETKPAGPSVILSELQYAGEQLVPSFKGLGAAIEGGKAGGVAGALIAFGAELLAETEGFQRVQEMWNKLFGQLVKAISPVISVIADALTPVFEALGEVAASLGPYFEVLGDILKVVLVPGLKVVAFAVETLAFVLGKIVNAIIGLINLIPGVNIGGGKDESRSERQFSDGGRRGREETTRGQTSRSILNVQKSERRSREINRGLREKSTIGGGQRGGRDRSSLISAEAAQSVTSGIQISNITGPTRDIFVDLLRPLRNLDTTFPAMLDELRNIRGVLTLGNRLAGESAVPDASILSAGFMVPQQDFGNQETIAQNGNGKFGQADGTIVAQTAPTRDIFVDLLRPLRNLDTTFPAMLDELRNIRGVLTLGNRLAGESAVPDASILSAGFMVPQQDFGNQETIAQNGNGKFGQADGTIVAQTAPTRDIFVDLLRPLRKLDIFQAMLDEFRNIREVLTPGHRPPSQSAVPGASTLRADFMGRQQDFGNQEAVAQNGNGQFGQSGTIVVHQLIINIDEVADLDAIDIDALSSRLNIHQRLDNRGVGRVFQPNR